MTALRGEIEAIGSRYPAVRLEHKPSAVVLHTRGVEPSVAAAAAVAAVAAYEVGGRYTGVHVLPGPEAVVELLELFVEQARVRG